MDLLSEDRTPRTKTAKDVATNFPRTLKYLPSKKRGMQNMQKDRPLGQAPQIRNAPTTTIQHATKKTTKLHRDNNNNNKDTTDWHQKKHYKR